MAKMRSKAGLAGAASLVTAAMLLASCSSGSGAGASSKNAGASSKNAGASSKPVQGVTSKYITIGTSQPSTGSAAVAGQGFDIGLTKAVKQINKEGGIDHHKIKLVKSDNQFTVPGTLASFRQLIQQTKVYAIVVPAETAGIPSAWPLVKQTGIPVFGPYEPATPTLPSVFELVATQEPQAKVEVKFLASKHLTKMAYIGINTANGSENLSGIKAELPKVKSAKLVYNTLVPSGSTVNTEVLAAKQAGAQAVILGTDNATADLVMKAAAAIGWHPQIIANTSAAGTGGSTTVGPAGTAANGFIGALTTALPTATTVPGVKEWMKQGKPAPGANYDLVAYESGMIFFHIMKMMGHTLSWKNFDKTAEKLKNYKGGKVFAPLTFGKLPHGHSGANSVAFAQYTKGTWTQISGFVKP